MRVVLLLALLVVLSFSQTDFTCDLEYRTVLMRNGVVKGTFKMFTGPNARMLIELPAAPGREAYRELTAFNQANGFNGGSALPYDGQIVFKSGTSCACETGHFDSSLPLLFTNTTYYTHILNALYSKGPAQINGCDVYSLRPTGPTNITPDIASLQLAKIISPLDEVQINPTTFFPCSAKFTSGAKMYTFKNCAATPFKNKTDTFAEPAGCKCGKPIDVIMVLDRSGSISIREFQDQKGFVTDFANQLDFGPLKANMAIVNFQSTAWLQSSITEGISAANVNRAINSLGCEKSCDKSGNTCNGDLDSCCCCCGTCISCGVRMGANEFPKGRSFAFKLLIVITDGFANTASPGYTCTSDASCNADLQASVAYAKTKFDPNMLAFYVVGVGSDRDISMPQLVIVADGKPDHVLRRQNFEQLASVNIELISRSCDENLFPCGGQCCGFCSCGKCQAPDTCDNTLPCSINTVPTGQVCCASNPVSCAVQSSTYQCHTWSCDNNPFSLTAGQCIINETVSCGAPANPKCFNRTCVNSTGLCKTTALAGCNVTECVPGNSTQCNDNNKCTTDACTADGGCTWSTVNCSKTLTPDQCSTISCDPILGCLRIPAPAGYCDDGSNCTIDSCDPVKGCVHINRTDCVDGRLCTIDTCDPIDGCLFIPVNCNNDGNNSTNCVISYCNETTGLCQDRAVACNFAFPAVIIGASLGTAALVGIVIAAVVCAAGVAGGGTYAYVQAGGKAELANVSSNPIYKSAGFSGVNPLYAQV